MKLDIVFTLKLFDFDIEYILHKVIKCILTCFTIVYHPNPYEVLRTMLFDIYMCLKITILSF